MINKKIIKVLKKQGKITKNGKIVCNCGRKVKIDEIVYIHLLDMNYFDWWMYQIDFDNKTEDGHYKTKVNPKCWYGYIGYVPILNNIIYKLHDWFHRKKYIPIIECKYCEEKNE